MFNNQFKHKMLILKITTGHLLNECKDVFETLDGDAWKKLESNIEDVMYELSSAYREIDMLEWRVRTENFY